MTIDSATITNPSYIRQVSENRREGHLLNIKGLTDAAADSDDGSRELNVAFFDFSLPVFLAWRDINQRRSEILPHLEDLMQGCDFYWTLETRDTHFNRMEGVRQFLQSGISSDSTATATATATADIAASTTNRASFLIIDPNKTDTSSVQEQPRTQTQPKAPTHLPFALSGPFYSSVTDQVNIISSSLGMVTTSGCATSPELDKQNLFARTIPTNQADARAVMTYYKHLHVDRVACIYVQGDAYGTAYFNALQQEASKRQITLLSFPSSLQTTTARLI